MAEMPATTRPSSSRPKTPNSCSSPSPAAAIAAAATCSSSSAKSAASGESSTTSSGNRAAGLGTRDRIEAIAGVRFRGSWLSRPRTPRRSGCRRRAASRAARARRSRCSGSPGRAQALPRAAARRMTRPRRPGYRPGACRRRRPLRRPPALSGGERVDVQIPSLPPDHERR